MFESLILIIAVIGFIANALKRVKPPEGTAAPTQASPTSQTAQRRPASGGRPGGATQGASNRPLAGAPQSGRIVSRAPMSGVAQQFAQERAQSDQQMAAAAEKARASAGTEPLATLADFNPLTAAIGSSQYSREAGVGARDRPSLQRSRTLLNGLIFAQILGPPRCRSKKRNYSLPYGSRDKNVDINGKL